MKCYLVYVSSYGELISECSQSTDIVGIFRTREEAERKRQYYIEEDIKVNDFILDEEIKDDYINRDMLTIFWKEQENYECYYEIYIQEMELN